MSTVPNTPVEEAPHAEFDYDVFLSYRRGDGRLLAHWLRSRLQSYRLPPRLANRALPPIKAYLDTTFERASGDFWAQNIEPAVRRSRYLLVLVTPSVFAPRTDGEPAWVEREIETFLALPQGNNVLVAVSGGNRLDNIPQVLRDRFPRIDVVDLNGTGSRFGWAQKSYLNDQTLTLIASICKISDVDMPVLRREEERRKRTLAIRVTSGALVLVAVLATLLLFALIQRRVAITQKTGAEARSLGLAAISDFAAGRQTQALLEAIDGGKKLQSLVGPNTPFSQYPEATPLLALHTVLDTIHERNRLEHLLDSDQLQGAASGKTGGLCSLPGGLNEKVAAESIPDAVLQNAMHSTGRILAKGCDDDGRFVISTATDGTVRMIDNLEHPEAQIIGLQGGATMLTLNPDSPTFKTTDVWGTVIDWDLGRANPRNRIALLGGDKTPVTSVAWSPDAQTVVTGARSGLIRIWTISGRLIAERNQTNQAILAVQFASDGKTVMSVDEKGVLQKLDRSGNLASGPVNLGIGMGGAIQAQFSSDGDAVALSIAGGGAYVFHGGGGPSVYVGRGHKGWIYASSIDSHTNLVATAGADDTIELSRLSGEAPGKAIQAGQDQVEDVAFSPDGKSFASAGADGTGKLWTINGTQTKILIGHTGKVLSVRFSPDGQLIATAGQDGTVRLWTSSGLQIAQLPGSNGTLSHEVLGADFGGMGLAFSPDSLKIAIAQREGSVSLYRIQSLDELVGIGCAWLKPYLDSHPDVGNQCH